MRIIGVEQSKKGAQLKNNVNALEMMRIEGVINRSEIDVRMNAESKQSKSNGEDVKKQREMSKSSEKGKGSALMKSCDKESKALEAIAVDFLVAAHIDL